jgi:antitoxin HicB
MRGFLEQQEIGMECRVKLQPDDNETFLVSVPDLPEAHTFGATEEEALARAVDAIETAIIGRMSDRQDIPAPSKVRRGERTVIMPTLSASKVALYRAMREQGVRKADLARRLGWHPPQVERLLDLRHASRHDQLDAAFAKLGKKLTVTVKSAA